MNLFVLLICNNSSCAIFEDNATLRGESPSFKEVERGTSRLPNLKFSKLYLKVNREKEVIHILHLGYISFGRFDLYHKRAVLSH